MRLSVPITVPLFSQARPPGPSAPKPKLRFSTPGCLCRIEEVPLHLRFNRFVHGGYRCGLSTSACVRSAAAWHNESLNIWTHAAAAAISLAALLTPWAPPGAPRVHTALRLLATIPMVASFALSIAYHTFMAHAACSTAKGGAGRYEALLCADVAGVVGVLSLPQGAIIWYGFHGWARLRGALALGTAAAAAYGTRATSTVDQTERAVPLGGMVAARLGALALRCVGYGAPCAPALARYGVMELLVALGGAANAAFWPERHFPGRLDCALNRRARGRGAPGAGAAHVTRAKTRKDLPRL
jgi:hypothetical protein